MTISSQNRVARFLGDGTRVQYPFNFKVFAQEDLAVVSTILSSGLTTPLTLNSDYTVALNADQNANPGGTITLSLVLPSGVSLTVSSAVAQLQPVDLTNNGGFYPSVINDEFDRLTILIQQNAADIKRSLKIPLSDTGATAEIPGSVVRAGKVLGFDSVGNPIAVTGGSGSGGGTAGVVTFNGRQGAVALLQTDVTALGFTPGSGGGSAGVTTFNTRSGAVTLTNADLTAAAGAAVITTTNLPTNAVTAFNSRKGAVTLLGADLTAAGGALLASPAFTGAPTVPTAATGTNTNQAASTAFVQATVTGSTAGVSTFNGRNGAVSLISSDVPTALINSTRAGTGAVAQSLANVLQQMDYTPEAFGAVGDGATDDSAAFNLMFTAIGAYGGRVRLLRRYRLASSVSCPANVQVAGSYDNTGVTDAFFNTGTWSTIGSALVIDSAATFSIAGGSSLVGLLITRTGQVYPTSDVSSFAGTAITGVGADVSIRGCLIIGFGQAFYSKGHDRIRIHDCNFDNVNNIHIENCYDVSYVSRCHSWPFATVGSGLTGSAFAAANVRTGIAYGFFNGGDWNKVSDCFSYAYGEGFHIEECGAMTLLNCSTDGNYASTVGFNLFGASTTDIRMISCQAAGQGQGVQINCTGTTDRYVQIVGLICWACENGIVLQAGDIDVTQCFIRDTRGGSGIAITTGDPTRAVIRNNRFRGCTNASVSSTGGSTQILLANNQYSGNGADLPDNPPSSGGGTAGVSSWNTRTGDVTLAKADVLSAGGAPLDSPIFGGTPQAPTAAAGTNNALLANTAFVASAISAKANTASPAFTGVPTAPTAAANTNTTQLATTAHCFANYAAKAGGATPFTASTFTGGNAVLSTVVAGTPALAITTGGPGTAPGISVSSSNPSTTAAIIITSGNLQISAQSSGNGSFFSNEIKPATTNTYDLGSTTTVWRALYLQNAPTIVSDARTKTNIEDADLGLAFIGALRPVRYTSVVGQNEVHTDGSVVPRAGVRLHYGFLAQEVKAALGPVNAALWCLGDPDDPDSPQALKYEEMLAPMVKAIQELTARVAQLENKLNANG